MNITSPAPEERHASGVRLRRITRQCAKELVIMCGMALVYLLLVLLASAKLVHADCDRWCSMHAWISGDFGALAFALALLNLGVATLFWIFASRTTRRERVVAGTVGCVLLAAGFLVHVFTLQQSLARAFVPVVVWYLLVCLPLASWLVVAPRRLLEHSYGAGTYLFRSGLFLLALFGLRLLRFSF